MTKNYAKNKAPHVDRLLDPRPGLSLRSASKGQYQARLELVDQLNAEEVGVKVFKATNLFVGIFCIIQVAFAHPVEPSCRNVNLHILRCLEGGTKGKPQTICIGNNGRTVAFFINNRRFIANTGTERPPVGEAQICTDREKIGVLPVILDRISARNRYTNAWCHRDCGCTTVNLKFFKTRPIRPTERSVQTQKLINIPRSRSHRPCGS